MTTTLKFPFEDEDEAADDDEVGGRTVDGLLKEALVYFDTMYKGAPPVTYNKKDEKGILMVRSSRALLHAFVG